jgi:hypothetical protein
MPRLDRPDAASFPAAVLGKHLSDSKFADEKWLDIRSLAIRPIMKKVGKGGKGPG